MSIASVPGFLTALKAPSRGHVLHSGHYNAAVLRAIYEAESIDANALLRQAVEACAPGATFGALAAKPHQNGGLEERFRSFGLGRLSLSGLKEDGCGTVTLQESHFANAWRRRYPVSRGPVCGIAAALLERTLSRMHDAAVTVEERRCSASGADRCAFAVRRAGAALIGRFEGHDSAASPAVGGECPGWLEPAQTEATDGGGLDVPGGPFATLPRELHVALAQLFEEEVPRVRGAKFGSLPGILLTEAAHRNGFNLFGEILASEAWREETERYSRSDREKLELLFEVVERLGWGGWAIQDFVAGERLIVRIEGSCEGTAHQELFGPSPRPRCAVAGGAAAAIMNLLYLRPASTVAPLSQSHYHALFRSPHSFRSVETRCAALGDTRCELVVNPLTG